MSLFEQSSICITPNGTKASKLYAIKPTSGAGDLSVVRATTATRVNSAGLIESVAVNVPRLDYTNSTCPSILVEPQRTNLNTYSNDFTNGVYTNQNITITANSTTAPDSTSTADKLIITGSGVTSIHREVSTTSGNYYTASVYVKKAETQYVNLGFIYSSGVYAGTQFDLNNGTIKRNNSSSYTGLSSTITSVANGWYRLTVTCIINTATAYPTILPSNAEWTSGEPRQTLTGNNTTGAYFWGLQLEAGSYATSYIPTTSASVTRNADVISKTGISSLIGQTEGVMYFDLKSIANNDFKRLSINGGSYVNSIFFDFDNTNTLYAKVFNGGSAVATLIASGINIANRNKIAIAYKNNDFSFYVNGSQVASQSSGSIPSGLANYEFSLASNQIFEGNINTAALWKTRLSNSELSTLTTI